MSYSISSLHCDATEIVDESRPTPTPEQVSSLEESVPLRHTHWAVLGLDVTLLASQHGNYDPAGTNFVSLKSRF